MKNSIPLGMEFRSVVGGIHELFSLILVGAGLFGSLLINEDIGEPAPTKTSKNYPQYTRLG